MAKWISILLLVAAGCSNKLETGYEPHKLGDLTPAERRGLYAQDFTLEARAAQADQQSNNSDAFHSHLPGGQP
jgi:hypothetical protein